MFNLNFVLMIKFNLLKICASRCPVHFLNNPMIKQLHHNESITAGKAHGFAYCWFVYVPTHNSTTLFQQCQVN